MNINLRIILVSEKLSSHVISSLLVLELDTLTD